MRIMVDALWKSITVLLLMEHAIVTVVFLCSLLIAFLLKNGGRNGLLLEVIYF